MPLHRLRRSGGNRILLEYLSTNQTTSAPAPSYTFSGVSIGTASADRVIIVSVATTLSSASVSSVTIGGVSATNLITVASSGTRSTIWAAAVPTGTTADIVFGLTESISIRFGCYKMTGTGGVVTPSNTGSTTVTTGTISLACTVPSGGAAVVIISDDTGTATHTATNYTENFDGTNNADSATGGLFFASATVSCENTTTNTADKSLVYASWGA